MRVTCRRAARASSTRAGVTLKPRASWASLNQRQHPIEGRQGGEKGQQGQGRVQGTEGIVIAGHDPAHGFLAGQQDLSGQAGVQGVAGAGALEQAAAAGDEQGQGLFPGLEGRITGQAVGPGQGQAEGARDQRGQELFALGGQQDEAGGG